MVDRPGLCREDLAPAQEALRRHQRDREAPPIDQHDTIHTPTRERGDRHENSALEEDQHDCIAAYHPLPVCSHVPPAYTQVGGSGEQHPGAGLNDRKRYEKPGAVDEGHPDGDGCRDEGAGDVEPSADAMDVWVTPSESRGELQRPEPQRDDAAQTMRNQMPADGMVVLPFGSLWCQKKPLVVPENEQRHQRTRREQYILRQIGRMRTRACLCHRCSGCYPWSRVTHQLRIRIGRLDVRT